MSHSTAPTCKSTPESSTLFTKGKTDVPPSSKRRDDQNLKSALKLFLPCERVIMSHLGQQHWRATRGTGLRQPDCATVQRQRATMRIFFSCSLFFFFFFFGQLRCCVVVFHPSIPFFPFNSSLSSLLFSFSFSPSSPSLTCPTTNTSPLPFRRPLKQTRYQDGLANILSRRGAASLL